jgi:hypothetical protein
MGLSGPVMGLLYLYLCNQHGQSCMHLPLTNVGTRFFFTIRFFAYVHGVCIYEFSTRGNDENETWSVAVL